MAAVTGVTTKLSGNIGFEIIECTATDGETYDSKFATVIGSWGNSQSRTGSYCSWSGRRVTYHCTSASDDDVSIFIVGV